MSDFTATAVATKQRTNRLAIAAFVMSLFTITLPAIVCGIVALRQIDRSGDQQKGRGLAIAAIMIGGLWMFVTLMILVSSASGSGY